MIRHATALGLLLMSSGLHAEGATPFRNADDIPPPGKPVAADPRYRHPKRASDH